MNPKGQTSLEYLLVLVIAIAVVVAIMVWMQASQRQISTQTGEQVNAIQCALTDCSGAPDDPVCKAAPCPLLTGSCNPGTHKCQV